MDSAGTSHPQRWWILVVLCMSMLVLVMDNTILLLAIPSLVRELGATPAQVQWIIDAYILVFAGLLLTAGALSDRYGRRRLLRAGLVIFGAASLAAALAGSPAQLIAARAIMGAGAALVMPSTLSILVTVFDKAEQRRAISVWSAVATTGLMAGPALGGLLLDHYFWGSVFVVNVPLVLFALLAAALLLPESRQDRPGPPDLLGAMLSTAGMSALAWAIISLPGRGWTAATAGALALALGSITAFVYRQARLAYPMIPLRIFRNPNFTGAALSVGLLTFGSAGFMLALTQYLQFVRDYTVLQAALVNVPFAVASVASNAAGAALVKRIDDRVLATAGMGIIAAGFFALCPLRPGDGIGLLIVSTVVMGLGGGLAGPAIQTSLMTALPRSHAGVGSALNDTIQQTGTALGVAGLGSVLAALYSSSLPATTPPRAHTSISDALALGDPAVSAAARIAFMDAMAYGMALAGSLALAATITIWTLLREHPAPARPEAVPLSTNSDSDSGALE